MVKLNFKAPEDWEIPLKKEAMRQGRDLSKHIRALITKGSPAIKALKKKGGKK